VSQGHRLGAERQHCEDELIAQLLLSPLAEMNIIADLAAIDPAGTDQLCLDSISATAVIFAWHTPTQASDELQRIGIAAQLLNHSSQPVALAATQQTRQHDFYYFDLNDPQPLEDYLSVIARVADEVEKSPVGLTNFSNGEKIPLATEPQASAQSIAHKSIPPTQQPLPTDDEEDRDELDDLMDALDRVEL
jgi:hypothetical protein